MPTGWLPTHSTSRWPVSRAASSCNRFPYRTARWPKSPSPANKRHNAEEPSMIRVRPSTLLLPLAAAASLTVACSAGDAKTKEAPSAPPAIAVEPTAAVEQPVARFIRATGTLTAEEQADVAAETSGRVIAAPVERGTAVSANAELIRLAPEEADAQLKEAEANAAQIEARLGLRPGAAFDVNSVPEVQN